MMETITKKSATQLALENLRSYIMDNSVRVGDRFPTEKDLCGTLGVGRGTVREAVKVLISQGFLEIRPGLGTFIRSKTPIQTDSLSNWFLQRGGAAGPHGGALHAGTAGHQAGHRAVRR